MYMRGLKRLDLHVNSAVRQAKPITQELLSRLNTLVAPTVATLRIWRTVWRVNVAFYCLLRWDDICRLQVPPSVFSIFL